MGSSNLFSVSVKFTCARFIPNCTGKIIRVFFDNMHAILSHYNSLLLISNYLVTSILITSSHKNKLWEESTTDEAVGMQGGYEHIGATSTGENGAT